MASTCSDRSTGEFAVRTTPFSGRHSVDYLAPRTVRLYICKAGLAVFSRAVAMVRPSERLRHLRYSRARLRRGCHEVLYVVGSLAGFGEKRAK
jgi:hypothetical protein